MRIYSKSFLLKSALIVTIGMGLNSPSSADLPQDKAALIKLIKERTAYCRGRISKYIHTSPHLWDKNTGTPPCARHPNTCRALSNLKKEYPFTTFTNQIAYYDVSENQKNALISSVEASTTSSELVRIQDLLEQFMGFCLISYEEGLNNYIPKMQALYDRLHGIPILKKK